MNIECPCCGSGIFELVVPKGELADEMRLRDAFARARSNNGGGGQDLQDRTSFTHDEAVDLYACRVCGLLVRDELEEDFTEVYANDRYDDDVLEQFLVRDVDFFSKKQDPYAKLLPPEAKVVEIGSYAGGFLHVAASWGWEVEGIDIGEDAARFANDRGYKTFQATLEERAYPDGSLDGLFIWNCFDQLPNPASTLLEASRVLRKGGPIVIRTPNAAFYRLCRQELDSSREISALVHHRMTRILGYNNLLGFPYQFGYAPSNLQRLLERTGFSVRRLLPSQLMAFPSSDSPEWAQNEAKETADLLTSLANRFSSIQPDVFFSPWMEIIAEKTT